MEKKKIISMGIALSALALVAAISSTTAWFLGASYLEVSSVDIEIGSKDFKITTDPEVGFFDGLDKSMLKQVDYFIPCSSAYSDLWLDAKETYPIFRSNYTECKSSDMTAENLAPVCDTDNGYFCQELFLQANANCFALVDPINTICTPNYEYNEKSAQEVYDSGQYPDLTKEDIKAYLNSVAKCVRFSILVLNNTDSESLADYNYAIFDPFKKEMVGENIIENHTYYAGLMDIDGDGFYDSYGGKETLYGQVDDSDKAVYDSATGIDTSIEGQFTCFNARHSGANETLNIEASQANGMKFVEEPSIAVMDADKEFYIPLKINVPRRFVLSIYLEGWDLDCTNLTMHAGFEIEINFMMKIHL